MSQPVPAAPLTAAEVEAFAGLLAMEDARAYSDSLLDAASASASAAVRRRAALAAGRIRDRRGLPRLLELLADPDTGVAATAAFALGQLGDTTVVPALDALLAPRVAASRPGVAAEAAYALGRLRSGAAEEALLRLLRSRDPDGGAAREVIGSALLAVWRFPRPADLEPIERWTRSADAELRWRAAYALVRRPTPAATPLLRHLAGDPDARVRAVAVRGLSATLADSAGLGAGATLPVVLAAVRDADYAVRVNAVRALGSYAAPEARDALAALLGSDEPHLALAAAESLGRLGTPAGAAHPVLGALALDDAAPAALRGAAVEALARVAPAEAVPVAIGLADAAEWRLRLAAARALATAAPDAPVLAGLLRDRDPRVAAGALASRVEAAGDSLAPLRPLLLEALGAGDVMVRTAALRALARSAEVTDFPLLLDAFGRAQRDTLDDAALAALEAVAALRGRGVEPERALFARFGRPDDYLVRRKAEELFGDRALAAWGGPLPPSTTLAPADYRRIVERWAAPANRDDVAPRVRIDTEAGSVVLRLFAADAPLTTESFLRLADAGYFDGQEWPRVVPNFVVQGGDPRGDTSGGPGYSIRDELNRHRYGTGTLGMALSGPDTGGSQFFVTHSPQPHLDAIYTVFGEVVEGQEVLERILPGERIHRVHIIQ